MAPFNLLLVVVGTAFVGLAIWRARGPYLRGRDLRAHRANLERYEGWRGARPTLPERGPDSAELMLQELQRQVRLWLAVGGIGLLLVFVGFWLG
ncbi:MAG: hypothetical protein ABWY52_03265 [Candidatus Limnocylindrales bacterium]